MGLAPSFALWSAARFHLKVLTVSLKRNLFWLVARKEITSISQLKGKILGTTTFGGSQHTAATRLIRKGGLDPEKDLTVVVGGDVPAQLQSLVSGVIDVAALSPPTVILARDKFHMNILGSAMEDLSNLQNGTAVTEKFLRENRDLLKRILRARAKANRYFWENEQGTSEVLAKFQSVDLAVARESYRLAKPAFTADGIPSSREIEEFLKADAELLKLKEPVAAAKIFDFSLQREVNQELGIKMRSCCIDQSDSFSTMGDIGGSRIGAKIGRRPQASRHRSRYLLCRKPGSARSCRCCGQIRRLRWCLWPANPRRLRSAQVRR